MPRPSAGLLTLCASLLLVSVTCRAQQFSERDRFVETERDAILIAPSDVVSAGMVAQAEWTPDGRSVLVVRTDMPSFTPALKPPSSFETDLQLWNRETRKSQLLWRTTGPQPANASIAWLPKTNIAFITLDAPPAVDPRTKQPVEQAEPQRWLFRLDARVRSIRALGRVPQYPNLEASPTQPLAYLATTDGEIRILRADGSASAPIRLPEKRQAVGPGWSRDGRALILLGIATVPKDPVQARQYRVDPLTLAVTLQEVAEPPPAPEAPRFEWRLRDTKGALVDGPVHAVVHPLWLITANGGPHHQALIAPDAEAGVLSPTGDGVLYRTESAAWVAPLIRVDRAQMIAAREAALRQTLQSNAKQVALAAMMYAQDYDELLPGSHQDIKNILMPYCKSEQLFNGLVYTYPGGALKDIADPANQELGYLPGPGGRAILFADGHVTWKMDEATPPGK